MKDKDKETGRDLITGYSTMSPPLPLEPWASSVNAPAFDTATRGGGVRDSKCRGDRHEGQGTVAKEPQTVLMRSSGIPHQRTFSLQTPRTTSLRVGKGEGHFTTSNADDNSAITWPRDQSQQVTMGHSSRKHTVSFQMHGPWVGVTAPAMGA